MSTMCPSQVARPACYHGQPARAAAQGGFALVSGIILLVLMASLGAYMVTFSTVQNVTSTQDLLGVRAYHAAQAGIEWGAYKVLTPENTNPPGGQPQYICPTGGTTLANFNGALAVFTIQVDCSRIDAVEAGNQIGIYQLTSTATFGTVGNTNYVERRLTATLSTCRTTPNGPSCP